MGTLPHSFLWSTRHDFTRHNDGLHLRPVPADVLCPQGGPGQGVQRVLHPRANLHDRELLSKVPCGGWLRVWLWSRDLPVQALLQLQGAQQVWVLQVHHYQKTVGIHPGDLQTTPPLPHKSLKVYIWHLIDKAHIEMINHSFSPSLYRNYET